MVENKITYGQLDQLLTRLGFVCLKADPDSKWYEHKDSNTVIILADKNSGELARPTEIVSTRFQLIHKGFLSEEEFDHFLMNGKVQKSPGMSPAKRSG